MCWYCGATSSFYTKEFKVPVTDNELLVREYCHLMMFYGVNSPKCLEWLLLHEENTELLEKCESATAARVARATDDPYKGVLDKLKDW